jgi:hypothetical protein
MLEQGDRLGGVGDVAAVDQHCLFAFEEDDIVRR